MNYKIEHKKSFMLAGFGFQFQTDFTDFSGLAAEKREFWNALHENGKFDQLKKIAEDGLEWSVNEVFQGAPWNYFAVKTSENLPEITRMIEMPESEYVVVSDQSDDENAIFDQLTAKAFGEILPNLTEVAYVGGPNAAFRQFDQGKFTGEIWIPVVKK